MSVDDADRTETRVTRRGFRSPSARHIVPSPRGLTLTRVEVGRLRPTCVPAGLRVAVKRVIANADETESCDSDARRICDFRCDVNGLSVRVRPLGGQEFDSLQMVRVAILERGRRISRPASSTHDGQLAAATPSRSRSASVGHRRERLGNQAAGGYVVYDSVDGTFELPAEQAMVVADEDGPVFLGRAFESIAACYADHDIFVVAFLRTSAGVGWQEHDERLFSGVLRLSRLLCSPRRRVASCIGRLVRRSGGCRAAAGGRGGW